MSAADQKRAAGEAAAALVETGMTVGLGTGSTAAWFVIALGGRIRDEGLALRCVATSRGTKTLAAEHGVPVIDLDEALDCVDLTVDGADEIGPGLALIKGGGGALLREKLVWTASRRCVVIADAAKVVDRLGDFGLPVEVAAFGHGSTARRIDGLLRELGYAVAPRLRTVGGAPFVTDNGGLIYDLPLGAIDDPQALADGLKALVGVVEHGLFLNLAAQALVGGPGGVAVLAPDGTRL
ncbi:ribose-5-phosphate isomerase RpiA [soil metagenome]